MTKRHLSAVLCAGLCVFASTSVAQDTNTQTADRPQGTNRAVDLDDTTSGTNIRASHLIGMNIENSAEKNVGEINDMVIDARERKIRYIAVTYGGFLGIGSDMHAVPFEAFTFKADPDDQADTVLVLNVTQEQLEGAKGFDENNWPNFADDEFTRSLDQRYETNRTQSSDRTTARSESRDAAGDRNTLTRRNQQDDAARTVTLDDKTAGTNIRASQLIGRNIQNSAEKNVGTVNDIVVNSRDGEVLYAAVSYGGFLGIGDELHAVPFEAFQFKTDPDDASETVLVLNVTQEQVEGAKGFDENNWPDFADKSFTGEVDKRYGVARKRDDATRN